jgi:hypothetical protein
MSSVGKKGRSFLTISDADLQHLARLAAADRANFFERHPSWAKLYRRRFLCSALCQGAALHYVTGRPGINDFDLYNFYSEARSRRWYAKALRSCDFGKPKFGKTINRPHFVGRRVDLMGRGIPAKVGADPVAALRQYLRDGRTRSARLLREQAIVILEPATIRGTVVWPEATSKRLSNKRLQPTPPCAIVSRRG